MIDPRCYDELLPRSAALPQNENRNPPLRIKKSAARVPFETLPSGCRLYFLPSPSELRRARAAEYSTPGRSLFPGSRA